MDAHDYLKEREKELACMYSICVLAAGAPDPETMASSLAGTLRLAMKYENEATCHIRLDHAGSGARVSLSIGGDESDGKPVLLARIPEESSGGWSGSIRMEYGDASLDFLPQEHTLLDSVAVITASMLHTASLVAELRSSSESLKAKNVALREIMSMIEDDSERMAASFREHLAADLLPLAERAGDANLSTDRRLAYIRLLSEEIRRSIASRGPDRVEIPALSPREREIAIQVRNGWTSKEIAGLLGIAEATVERHRHNIRRKLGVTGKAANLGTLLDSSETIFGHVEPISKVGYF